MATELREWSDRPGSHYTARLGREVKIPVPVMDFDASGRQPAGNAPKDTDAEQDRRSRAAAAVRRNR